MQTLQPDNTLQGGKYRIIKKLSQGGFGITYLAEHTQLGAKVAIKELFIKNQCSRDDSTLFVTTINASSREIVYDCQQKFVKEARNIARLHHPNIIRISDIFEENGTAYYVMDYCEGGSLADLIRQYPNGLNESVAVRYIRQVARALDYIHRNRMMHLDIKPGNIMLDANDNCIVIDFGLSKHYDTKTGDETTGTEQAVTEGYAPIEQYMQSGVKQFSPSTDIYSLAATLYKLLTGETPPNASEVSGKGLPDFVARSSTKKAILAAMKNRELRPQSISEWLAILDENPPMPRWIKGVIICLVCALLTIIGIQYGPRFFGGGGNGGPIVHNDTLTVSPKEIKADYNGTTETITVESNDDWTVKRSESWIKLNGSENDTIDGTGDDSFKVTITKRTSANDHNGTITVTGKRSGISSTIDVKQTGTGSSLSDGTLNLGYATWEGAIRDGKPYGIGTMTYKQSYKINSRYTAEPEDKVHGDFKNGRWQSTQTCEWTQHESGKTVRFMP